MYTPSHIANFFLDKAREENSPITQLKLMKLVYIVYGWVLATMDSKLFDEEIEAWKHGPVIPSLYHEFKHFRYNPITSQSIFFDLDTGESQVPKINPKDNTTIIIEKVWDIYKHLTAPALVNKTHEKGTPWEKHYKEDKNEIISNDDIKDHFKNKILEYIG